MDPTGPSARSYHTVKASTNICLIGLNLTRFNISFYLNQSINVGKGLDINDKMPCIL